MSTENLTPLDELPVDVAVEPNRPSITPAQIAGSIPLIAQFLHAWGVYSMSGPQQESLQNLVYGGIALFGADAIIRFGRNLAQR